MASSQFGRFLAGKLDLHLLERRPDEWRLKQLGVNGGRAVPARQAPAASEASEEKKEKKREARDEIDDLFESVEKKTKKPKVKA